ncbi:MAG TPA: hypothetical protein QF353_07205, partial [Gammaproteobacteria bacterium]|nr:hypothetical protein [Gammaproteobacteria bacterium]
MHKLDKKRKHSSGEPSDIGLFAKKSRTSSKLTGIEIKVVAGDLHTFLYIKGKGGEDKLYATGYNIGQLGLGDRRNRYKWTEVPLPQDFSIEKVIAGGFHTFLKGKGKDGENQLYVCGNNDCGQLGVGNTNNRSRWTKVPFPKDFSIEKVMAGGEHSFLKGKGKDGEDKLYACGKNDIGQLGLGDMNNRNQWTEVILSKGFTIDRYGHSFLKGKGADGEDTLYALGLNNHGQLGLGDTMNRAEWTEVASPQGFSVEKVIPGEYHSFLKGKGKDGQDMLYAAGYNRYGQLGLGDRSNRYKWTEVSFPKGFEIEKVIACGDHSFLKGKDVNGEDKIFACGRNSCRQLGLGDTKDRNQWTEVPFPKGFEIEKVIAGGDHSFLKGKDVNGEDKLYATGDNSAGQLGLGDTTNRDKWTEVPIADLLKKL